MKTMIVERKLKCDLCTKRVNIVWDRPAPRAWAYVCAECNRSLPSTILGINITNCKPWFKKYPKYAAWMKEAFDKGNCYAKAYANKDTLDMCYAEYGDEGLKAQIAYVVSNYECEPIKKLS